MATRQDIERAERAKRLIQTVVEAAIAPLAKEIKTLQAQVEELEISVWGTDEDEDEDDGVDEIEPEEGPQVP